MASNLRYDPRRYGLLWRALAMSLLLHAFLLLQSGFGEGSLPVSGEKSLIAMLRPRAESVSSVTAAFPKVMPDSRVQPRVHDTAAATAAKVISVQAEPDSAVSASSNIVAVNNNAGTKSPATATATNDADLDFVEAKKSYLFAIGAAASRVKKYPPRAFAAGWTGTAVIRISVAAGGNVQPPQLQRPSGYADIDNAALSFVGIALKQTPVPESLRGRAFDLLLPVSFTINDE